MPNIFRQAQVLLQQKPVSEMTEEELHIVNAATIPLTLLKMFNDMTILDGLESLAEIVEGEACKSDCQLKEPLSR